MVLIRIMMDREIFRMISTSSTGAGSGMTRNRTMTTTISDMPLFKIRFIFPQQSVFCYILLLRRYRYTSTSATALYSSGGISRPTSPEA